MVLPDKNVLNKRLKKVSSTKRNKNPKSMTIEQLVNRLRSVLIELSPDDINELADYIAIENLAGLDVRLRTNLLKLCDELLCLT